MDDFADPIEQRRLSHLLMVVLLLIVYGSLYPFSFATHHSAVLAWAWDGGAAAIRDAIINVALYFPVGYLLFHTRGSVAVATFVSLAVSGGVELLQAFDHGRVSSLPDLLLNVSGGAAGAWTASRVPSRISAAFAIILLAIVARTFPFFPSGHLHWSAFQLDQALFATADWLAVRCALSILLRRTAVTRELGLLMLIIIPARMFLLDQQTSLSEVAGALVALCIGYVWPARAPWRPQQFAPFMLLAIIGRELLPFHFTATPQTFHWIPFQTLLEGPQTGAVIFLGKLLLYTSSLWLLDPDVQRIWRFALVVAGLVGILEWVQCYLPGRTPDISDSIIVLIGACALSAVRRSAAAASVGQATQQRWPVPQNSVTS